MSTVELFQTAKRSRSAGTSAMAFCLLFIFAAASSAQTVFKVGEMVEASPMSLKDDKYYKECRVTSYDAAARTYSVNCGGVEYAISSTFVRAARRPAPADQPPGPITEPKTNAGATGNAAADEFKIGDRVLASVNGLKADRNYRPCTVRGPLKDNAYPLRCDAWAGFPANDFAVRPDWIKLWNDRTPAPSDECLFTKSYSKPLRNAAPSAALFKSVIFHKQNSVQDFYDFGVTFVSFNLGRVFANRQVSIFARDVDTAPVGTRIHEVNSREIICQKSSTIVKRWVRDIEYACYKTASGEWTCKNGAPKYIEQTSIPID